METECVELGRSNAMFSSNPWLKVASPKGAWPKLGSLKTGEVSVVENGDWVGCGQATKTELIASSRQVASVTAIACAMVAPFAIDFWRTALGR